MTVPITPVPQTKPSERQQDHDFALYVDGRRIPADHEIDVGDFEVTVTFRTSRNALDHPETADVRSDIAWGGWKAGDTAHLYQPAPDGRRLPENGYVVIEKIIMPMRVDDPVYFVCTSLTAVHDWITEQMIVNASERVRIPADWFRR